MTKPQASRLSIDVVFFINSSIQSRDIVLTYQATGLMRQLDNELGLKNNIQFDDASYVAVRKRLLHAYKNRDFAVLGISIPIVYWLFFNYPEKGSEIRALIEKAAGSGCSVFTDCVERGRAGLLGIFDCRQFFSCVEGATADCHGSVTLLLGRPEREMA